MKVAFEINEDLSKRFDMALQLTGENRDTVMESMMRAYVVQSFSQTASAYQNQVEGCTADKNFGKAAHKISKWAGRPMVIPSKIIRAFLQLSEETAEVYYSDLMLRCSDKENHPDEYVATFANNFAQMKFDDEKSHGKVFEVNSMQRITLWENIKEIVMLNREKFKNYSTIVGYRNKNQQVNLGKTEERGTDRGQWFYRMRCEFCQTEYKANGSDIHLKKCPVCQGGANSGRK